MKNYLKEIKQIESIIEENLCTLKGLERESNVVSAIMEYKSRNNKLRKFPTKVHVLMPTFCPEPVDRRRAEKFIGSMKPLAFTTDKNGYTLKTQIRPHRELLNVPEVINTFNIGYKNLRSVSFQSEQKLWTTATEVSEIKCFNMNGDSINTTTIETGNFPEDIAVTSEGSLLYSDVVCRTVNKFMNGQIQEIIRLQGWTPGNMCVTSSGDLLVVMCNDAKTQDKVVRFSGSIEKQTNLVRRERRTSVFKHIYN